MPPANQLHRRQGTQRTLLCVFTAADEVKNHRLINMLWYQPVRNNVPKDPDRALCSFSYTGKRSSSNMLIIDVKMLSGFVPVKSSLDKVNLEEQG